MDIPAQCGTTAGRGKDCVEGGKGEVGITGTVTIVALEEAVVKGVAEGEGQSVTCDIRVAAWAVSIITGRGTEAVGVRGCECMVEQELHACAEEAACREG